MDLTLSTETQKTFVLHNKLRALVLLYVADEIP